ncbi:MAG: hypothetical protein Kow00109_03740 [Acidobacteriota bacterium]
MRPEGKVETEVEVVVCRRIRFSAGHRYYKPDWSEEKNREMFGRAYTPAGHGHNFILEAYVTGPIDPQTGMILNLRDLDSALRRVVEPLDHHFLNTDVPEFRDTVPTTENLAAYLYRAVAQSLDSGRLRLVKVRLYEDEDLWVDYGPAAEAVGC